jgi:glycine/D-amino acid oxidase-like deaminating enzyme
LLTRWTTTFPKFREISDKDLFPNAVDGFSFETVTIDVPKYLNYLLKRFLEKGGTLIRGHVQHIDQVLEAGSTPFKGDNSIDGSASPPDAVVVCTGLGARFLGGVEDKTVYPSRGQTVILHAPWVRSGCAFEAASTGEWTYIIPRRSGNVVVGGTLGVNDWQVLSRNSSCWT